MALPDEASFKRDIQAINQFQIIVMQNMIKDQDYGVIPGTGNKPTLLKPGAEKIAKLLGLSDQYIIVDRQEDWDRPFFRYLVKCQLISVRTQQIISEGLGECNSMESKYRYRDAKRKCPDCGTEAIIKGKEEYGGGWLCYKNKGGCGSKFLDNDPKIIDQEVGKVENDDIYSIVNTLLKMAKKRALVDASLSAGRLSNIFTQDIEDLTRNNDSFEPKKTEVKQAEKQEKPRTLKKNEQGKPGEKPQPRDPETIKNTDDLLKACYEDFGMQPNDVYKELCKGKADIVDPALDYSILYSAKLGK